MVREILRFFMSRHQLSSLLSILCETCSVQLQRLSRILKVCMFVTGLLCFPDNEYSNKGADQAAPVWFTCNKIMFSCLEPQL